ncbi:MAG: alkaline phosphatase [Gammaproteobacteria bacterium]|nr:alkaline phosphatase [Gammaproteobacteria bacterium]MDH3768797.1 alkaline phosphatase [Gammaproteobacteria bacterium]
MRLLLIVITLLVTSCASMKQPPPRPGPPAVPDLDNIWYEAGQATLGAALKRKTRPAKAKNVIFFVGDGMSVATVSAARILEGQQAGATGEEHALAFERFPYVALSKTYNTNAQVPDSAGTATAMLSGVKTIMGAIGVDASVARGECSNLETASVPTLLELAEQRGIATGVISTARITHATPASSYAHSPNREWEAVGPEDCADIARQLVEFDHGDGPEVVLGGGRAPFMPATEADPEYSDRTGWRQDNRNLITEWLGSAGTRSKYVWNKEQFDAVSPRNASRLLGLFEPSHMQYEADRNDGPGGEPSLADMVAKAIRMLKKSDDGYFLFVEGGRIDHAHHGANAYRALHDTIAMSDAVATARQMTDTNDTLIIVTADHGHVMEIAGYPTRGNPILGKVISLNEDGSPANVYALDAAGLPYTTLVYGNGPGHVGASDSQTTGPKVYPHQVGAYEKTPASRTDLTNVDTQQPDYMQESAVPTGSETHSGTDVPIYADGPGASLLHGVHEQNYIFHVMAYALLAHR